MHSKKYAYKKLKIRLLDGIARDPAHVDMIHIGGRTKQLDKWSKVVHGTGTAQQRMRS
jgi:hypothetical protein